MFTLRQAVLALALTMTAFSAGLAAGNALAGQSTPGAPQAPSIAGGTPIISGPANSPRCSSTEGPEDFATCKAYFGE